MENEEKKEYLTFLLGEESYGINILNVQEIKEYGSVTPIANAPDFIKGVINLRGFIVPIIDLRIKFNLGDISYDESTIIIIVKIEGKIIGIVVDAVSGVESFQREDLSAAPSFNTTLNVEYIEGIAIQDEKLFVLINIEKMLTHKEMGIVEGITDEE